MKKSVVSLFMIMLAWMSVQFSACTEDTTTTDPTTDPREKFLGTWTVDESCVRLNYEVEITAATGSDSKVLIDNFAFTGPGYNPAYGYVDGNTIDLPKQTIGDNWVVQGSGTYRSDGTIHWAYNIQIAANASHCEADYQ